MRQDELASVLFTTLEELCAHCSWEQVNLTDVAGISFDVYPWHAYCALSIRSGSERNEYNPADWKLFELARTDKNSAFLKAAEAWHMADDETPTRCAHQIFCAAAMAMLDRRPSLVPGGLRDHLLPEDFGFNHCLELMVFDVDRTFSFNYCEYLSACRQTGLSNDAISRVDPV